MSKLPWDDDSSPDATSPDSHLTADLLHLALSGDLPTESFFWLLLGHLQELCPHCATAVETFSEELDDFPTESHGRLRRLRPTSYRAAFEAAFDAVHAATQKSPALLAGPLDDLQALSHGARFARIATDLAMADPELCLQLLDRGRIASAGQPQEAEELARLALAVAERIDPRRFPRGLIVDCQVEAWALLGEARTSQGDRPGGALALTTAQSLATAGSGDPLTQAMVLSAKARLLRLEGRLEGCVEVLSRAVGLYGSGGDPHSQGLALVHRGLVLRELGRTDEARRAIAAGIDLLDPQRDPDLADQGQSALLDILDAPPGTASGSVGYRTH